MPTMIQERNRRNREGKTDRSKPHLEPAYGRDDSMGEMDVNADGRKTVTTEYGKDGKDRRLYRTEEAAPAPPAARPAPPKDATDTEVEAAYRRGWRPGKVMGVPSSAGTISGLNTNPVKNLGKFAHPPKKK